jgi:C4-dicarboxylate transporter, DctM subunit
MTPITIGIIAIFIMLLLFLTQMPIAFAMAIVGFVGFSTIININAALALLSRTVFDVFTNYELTTIPLFIFMGQLGFNSGISRRLYDTGYKFLGNIRGGLAMATVVACTAFGAICGSSPATAATMATIGLPEMKRYNYDDELATGAVASGGGIGMIMPPSVIMIIYGIMTQQSIGELFISGIIPAILLTILFMISIYIICTISPKLGPPGESFTWAEKFKSLLGIGETLTIFILVIGGIFFGLFTPTEAAAIGAFGVLVVALIRRHISWDNFVKSIMETLRTSCMVMILIAGATILSKFLAVTRIPFEIAGWVAGLNMPAVCIIGVIIIIYIIGGCFIDALALITLTVPIFYPVVQHLGYDPIWFGLIIVMVTQIGVITPPVGINVYVVYGVAKSITKEGIPLETIFKGIIPFLIATIIGTILMTIFPEIVLFLPKIMY